MTEIALKPCPFCGGDAYMSEMDDRDDRRYWFRTIECQGCGTEMENGLAWRNFKELSLEEAARKVGERLATTWNTRTPPRITEEAVTAAAMALVGAKWDNGHRIVSGEKLSVREMASIEARAALTAALPLMGGDRGVEIGFPEGSENHKLAMEHNRDR